MRLEWMGKYRNLMEKMLHNCNVYASMYKQELEPVEGVQISFSQMQVVEYLLENEEKNQNMSIIASRLGFTFSTFSKLVSKLEEKGLLEKYFIEGNRKNIVVRVSELGKKVYEGYANTIYQEHFAPMFKALDEIPAEYVDAFYRALDFCSHCKKEQQSDKPVLIPYHKE